MKNIEDKTTKKIFHVNQQKEMNKLEISSIATNIKSINSDKKIISINKSIPEKSFFLDNSKKIENKRNITQQPNKDNLNNSYFRKSYDIFEYNNNKHFEKDLMHNIYQKESGDILKKIISSNQKLKEKKNFSENSKNFLNNELTIPIIFDNNNDLTVNGYNDKINTSAIKFPIISNSVDKKKKYLFHNQSLGDILNNKSRNSKNLDSKTSFRSLLVNLEELEKNKENKINLENSMENLEKSDPLNKNIDSNCVLEQTFSFKNTLDEEIFNNCSIRCNLKKNNFDKNKIEENKKILFKNKIIQNQFKKKDIFSLTHNKDLENNKKYSKLNFLLKSNSEKRINFLYSTEKIFNKSKVKEKKIIDNNSYRLNNQNNSNFSTIDKNIINIQENNNKILYCPCCDHCNNTTDENLIKYQEILEGKNFIRKCFGYIINNLKNNQKNFDFFGVKNENKNQRNNPQDIITKSNDMYKHLNLINFDINSHLENNNKINVNNSEILDLENIFKQNPNKINNKIIIKIVSNFLESILNKKISLNSLIDQDTINKFEDVLISQGLAYEEKYGEISFDKELEKMLTNETKENIKNLFKSNFLLILFIEKNLEIKKEIDDFHNKEIILENRKNFLILFL